MRRIGIDLGGTKIEGVIMNDAGKILRRLRVPTPREDYEATLGAIRQVVEGLEAEGGARLSVGIGTPGTLCPATGRIKNANSTWLLGHPLDVDLEERLGRPVRLANDANCFALSEARDGAGEGLNVVFGVIIGTGVGGGVVVGGRILEGLNRIGGEWGHNPIPWPRDEERPGPRCYCGRNGCIETFVSGPGLTVDLEKEGGKRLEASVIAQRAAEGDGACSAALERHAERLARSLAHVVNIMDPDVIVLGGGLSRLEHLYERVPALWGPWVFSDRVATPIRPPVHGDSGGARGAAWLWE